VLKVTYSDWEIEVPAITTTRAARADVSQAKSWLGTEIVITPVAQDGEPHAFGLKVQGTIRRLGVEHAGESDILTLGFIQNLRVVVRGGWYENQPRENLLTRRPIDRLPLVDHSTDWYKKETATSEEPDFELEVSDTPHTGFPSTFPNESKSALLRASLGGAFTTCFAVQGSWNSAPRHALFAVDWVQRFHITRNSKGTFDPDGKVTVGPVRVLNKAIDAAGIVHGGPTPNRSEHVFLNGIDRGATSS